VAKLERICRKLELQPTDHLLEIGTGWGGFALHAASRYGCRVTTTTISRQQYELAHDRIHAAGLQGRVTLLLEDYRDLRGGYDKLASIEMIEAIGHDQYETFFRQCGRLLKRKARCCCSRSPSPTSVTDKRATKWISSNATCSRAAASRRSPR